MSPPTVACGSHLCVSKKKFPLREELPFATCLVNACAS